MTRRCHAGGTAHYDLLDENLGDCVLQAEVVGRVYVSRRAPWRCQEEAMDRSEALPGGGGGEMFN